MVSSQCSSFQIERFPFADDTLSPFFHHGEKIGDGGDIANQGEVMVIVTAISWFMLLMFLVLVLVMVVVMMVVGVCIANHG